MAVGDVFEKSIAKDYEKINVIINTLRTYEPYERMEILVSA